MILHRIKDRKLVAQITEKIFYPLWDLGLEIGHSTRTIKDCLQISSTNFEIQTSLLDSRLVEGDIYLLQSLQNDLLMQVRSRGGKRFLKNIIDENERRYQQYGQVSYLLEPDLKEGEGGLRDMQAILWAAKGLLGCSSIRGLVAHNYISNFDADALEQSHEFLLLIRNFLHYLAGRKNDRLLFEYQLEISKTLGFKDENGISGIEKFMRVFYSHTSTTDLISRVFWEQVKEDFLQKTAKRGSHCTKTPNDGIMVSDGKLSLSSPSATLEYPSAEIKLFRRSIEENLPIDYRRIGLLREGISKSNSPANWNQSMREDFFRILAAGHSALSSLEIMSYLGILTYHIPEWDFVRCLSQYDSYHLYTVDMHLFLTVAEIQKIGAGAFDSDNPLLRQIYNEINRKDLLLLSGFLHDIGKGFGKGHGKRGAKISSDICTRMGLPLKDVKTVSFLVDNHLLLIDTATRRDLNDEDIIIDLAETIIDEEKLKMLYVLTVADSLATGPKAWDNWKDSLLRELFLKALRVIRGGEYTSKKRIEQMKKTVLQVRKVLLDRFSEDEIELFIRQMPHSYLLAQDPEDIARHFELMRISDESVFVDIRRDEGVYELTLVAKDHPGLFYKTSGVLALHGINILGTQAYTRSNGVVLDIFKVEDYFKNKHGVGDNRWDKVKKDIERALEGKISLEYRIAEKAKRYKSKEVLKKPSKVEIDNQSSDFYTIIEVHAQDRIGLLYSITRAMHDLSLDIHLAKVSTNVDKVIDVFYVWDIYGQKLDDQEQIQDVKKAILMAIEQS